MCVCVTLSFAWILTFIVEFLSVQFSDSLLNFEYAVQCKLLAVYVLLYVDFGVFTVIYILVSHIASAIYRLCKCSLCHFFLAKELFLFFNSCFVNWIHSIMVNVPLIIFMYWAHCWTFLNKMEKCKSFFRSLSIPRRFLLRCTVRVCII